MNRHNRLFVRSAILVLLMVALIFAIYSALKKDTMAIKIGKEAPNFELQQLDGNFVKLSDFRGKSVVLNFWGTWCVPCKTEMPEIEKQFKHFKEQGLVVLGVNIGESPIPVGQFVSQYGLTFPILLDQKREVTQLYKIGPIPTTFFINKKGEVKDYYIGQMSEQILTEKISAILQ